MQDSIPPAAVWGDNVAAKQLLRASDVRLCLRQVLRLEVQRLAGDALIHVEHVLNGRLEMTGGVVPCMRNEHLSHRTLAYSGIPTEPTQRRHSKAQQHAGADSQPWHKATNVNREHNSKLRVTYVMLYYKQQMQRSPREMYALSLVPSSFGTNRSVTSTNFSSIGPRSARPAGGS